MPFTGVDMKGEIDLYNEAESFLCDVKTADDVSEWPVFGDIKRYGYDVQAACYTVAAELWSPTSQWDWYWCLSVISHPTRRGLRSESRTDRLRSQAAD